MQLVRAALRVRLCVMVHTHVFRSFCMYVIIFRIADELFLLNGGSDTAKPAEAKEDAAAPETVPGVTCSRCY